MAAVERVASSDPNPADPFRGLYISDDRALELSRGESVSDADDRLAHVSAARSGSTCSTPPCWRSAPRPSSTRATAASTPTCRTTSRASSRARGSSGTCSSGDGVSAADVMMAFERTAPLRAQGAIRLQGDAQTPLAERPIKLSDRLAAHLLGVGMDDPPAGGKLRMVPHPDHDPGRDEAVAALAAMLAHPSSLPVVLAGPDAEALVAQGLRPRARRRAHPRDRQRRHDGRGGADRRARGPPARLRGARGPRARPSARGCCARSSAAASASSCARRTATRRSRSATARRC